MRFALASRDGKQVAVVESRDWPGDDAACLYAITAGVTKWLNTTPDGQRHKIESKGRFTFQDLAEYCPDCFLKGTSLGNCLRDQGLKMTTVTLADLATDTDIVDVFVDSNLYRGEE